MTFGNTQKVLDVYKTLLKNNIITENFKSNSDNNLAQFRVQKSEQKKVRELLENEYPEYKMFQSDIAKLSIIGYGITQDNKILTDVINILEARGIKLFSVNLTQSKIEILTDKIEDSVVEELHKKLIG